MNKILSIAILLLTVIFANAQEPVFVQGDKVANLSIGFGNTLYSGSLYSSTVPPLSLSFEYGFKDGIVEKGSIGLGGYLGYSSYKWEYLGWGYKYSNLIIGARGTFHYPLLEKLDTYTGLMIGVDIVSDKEFGSTYNYNYSAQSGGLMWAWYAGGRYYFTDNLAGLLELGYGIAYFNIGLALKL